jgi:hypothetical protein
LPSGAVEARMEPVGSGRARLGIGESPELIAFERSRTVC